MGTAKELDDGFYKILTSGQSSYCLAGEEYIVDDLVVELLKVKGVKFALLE